MVFATSKLGRNALERKPGEVGRRERERERGKGRAGKGRMERKEEEKRGRGGLRGVSRSQRTPTSLTEHLET